MHYAGVGCAMNELAASQTRHGVALVEDAAHGILATYDDRPLGSFGRLAALSFHETKNVHCGEGGALLINDPAYRERAEILLDKGTNRRRFFRGQVDKYSWVDVGSSYAPSEINAAFLLAQLEDADAITARRLAIWRATTKRSPVWRSRASHAARSSQTPACTTRTCTTCSSPISTAGHG